MEWCLNICMFGNSLKNYLTGWVDFLHRDGQYKRKRHRQILILIFYSVLRWHTSYSDDTTQLNEQLYLSNPLH